MPINEQPIEKLLDMFQLETISFEDEVVVAFKELVSFGAFKDKRNVVAVFNAIKKKVRKKHKSKDTFFVTIKENCKKCDTITLKNDLKIATGLIEYPCCRCKNNLAKRQSCRKCGGSGKIKIVCPACKGKKYVLLKRKVDRSI